MNIKPGLWGVPVAKCDVDRVRPSFVGALAHASFRRTLTAFACSALGQGFGVVAVTLLVYERSGSHAWAAMVVLARLLPYVLFAPLAGALCDRIGSAATLRWSLLLRAAIQLVLLAAAVLPVPATVLIALMALSTVAGTPTYPAMLASVTGLVPQRHVPAGTALVSLIDVAGFAVGPAIGGLLVAVGHTSWPFACSVMLFLTGLAVHPRQQVGRRVTGTRSPMPRVPIRAFALLPLVTVAAVNLVDGAVLGLLLPVVERLDGESGGFAVLNAALGAGTLAAVLVVNEAARPARRRVLATSFAAACLPVALLALTPNIPFAAVLLTVVGAGGVVVEVLVVARLQAVLPAETHGRVFGLLDALVVGSLALGAVLGQLVTRSLGIGVALVFIGAILPALALGCGVLAQRCVDGSNERAGAAVDRSASALGLAS